MLKYAVSRICPFLKTGFVVTKYHLKEKKKEHFLEASNYLHSQYSHLQLTLDVPHSAYESHRTSSTVQHLHNRSAGFPQLTPVRTHGSRSNNWTKKVKHYRAYNSLLAYMAAGLKQD